MKEEGSGEKMPKRPSAEDKGSCTTDIASCRILKSLFYSGFFHSTEEGSESPHFVQQPAII